MTTMARITISKDTANPVESFLFGAWFWHVHVSGMIVGRSGFARTEARARARAEEAVQQIAAHRRAEVIHYHYHQPLTTGSEPTP